MLSACEEDGLWVVWTPGVDKKRRPTRTIVEKVINESVIVGLLPLVLHASANGRRAITLLVRVPDHDSTLGILSYE